MLKEKCILFFRPANKFINASVYCLQHRVNTFGYLLLFLCRNICAVSTGSCIYTRHFCGLQNAVPVGKPYEQNWIAPKASGAVRSCSNTQLNYLETPKLHVVAMVTYCRLNPKVFLMDETLGK